MIGRWMSWFVYLWVMKWIAGAAEVLPFVDIDLKKIAARVVDKAKEICATKLVSILIIKYLSFLIDEIMKIKIVDNNEAAVLYYLDHGDGGL